MLIIINILKVFVVCGWVTKSTAKMDRTNESFNIGPIEEVGSKALLVHL